MSSFLPNPVAQPADRRLHFDLRVLVLGALLLLAWDLSGLDLALQREVGTPQGFPWKNAWVTSTLLHQGGRTLAWAVFGAMLLDAAWRPWIIGPTRAQRWRAVAMTLACLLLVPGLKRISRTSCPWEQSEFGGHAQYISHWSFGRYDGGDGHCFPSGHAVAAFAFLSLYFLLRESRPRLARACLWGVLGVGGLFGAAQLLRGAHYLSHTAWSAWLCWLICLALQRWPLRSDTAPTAATDSRQGA